jgi:hypothetical protein
MPIFRTWRTRIAVGLLVQIAVAAVGSGIYYVNGSFATRYLHPDVPSGWSVWGGHGHPGDIFDVGIEFGNTSTNGTIIMRPATFPLGLPALCCCAMHALVIWMSRSRERRRIRPRFGYLFQIAVPG